MNCFSRVRSRAAVSASLALLLTLAACGSDQPEPIPPAPPSESNSAATSSPSSTETDKPSGVPAGWEEEFSDRQLRAYQAALSRWERYRRGTGPIYAEGKNTPAARRFLRRSDLRWREQIGILEGIEQAGLREIRPPEPLRSRAQSVEFGQDGTGTVVITQCTDYTAMRWERNGSVEKGLKPNTLVTPLVIQMEKPAQRNWMLVESQLEGTKSCAG